MIDKIDLVRKLERNRDVFIQTNGAIIPKNIQILESMLEKESNVDNRWDIFSHLILECQIIKDTTLHCKYAKKQSDEFKDALSIMIYSRALIESGDMSLGMETAKYALKLAIEERSFINDTGINYVREAIHTGCVDYLNEALRLFVRCLEEPRTEDCRIELDWVESALELGADADLVDKICKKA